MTPGPRPTASRDRSPTPTQPDDVGARPLLGLIVLAGLGLRLALMSTNAGLTMDSPLYVRMSESLLHGEKALGPAHHGYPLLIAATRFVIRAGEWPGRIVSLAAGVLLVPLVYRLARHTLGARWSLLAAALVAVHPLLAVYSGPIMTESSFLLPAFASLLWIERRQFLAGGILMGLAYVVRPEALIYAVLAAAFSRGGRRGAGLVLLGFAIATIPYFGYLRIERGAWMLTPKEALVRPVFDSRATAEWRIGSVARPASEPQRNLVDRIRWAAPSVAASYAPHFVRHFRRLLEAWPWPLLLLSAVGIALRRGPLLAPLLYLGLLPALAAPFDLRFAQLFVPALAVYAAVAAAWAAPRWPRAQRAVTLGVLALVLGGMTWSWVGAAGRHARYFDDGPMPQMRRAGAWLRLNGRPGATVMDRKAYVPFYAGMTHVQLPDDDYDTILDYAVATGVDYLVLEEFIVERLRPQFLPLMVDEEFRSRERRLRLLFIARDEPLTGVAVLEVMRGTRGVDADSTR